MIINDINDSIDIGVFIHNIYSKLTHYISSSLIYLWSTSVSMIELS